jgi:hypothetical protein
MKRSKVNSSLVSRRDFLLKAGVSLAGTTAANLTFGMVRPYKKSNTENNRSAYPEPYSPLKKGQTFNESVEFADLMTGRATRRLTRFRQNNMQPTYHINSCFSADSRYMVLSTQLEDGASAILKAEVATGEMTVIATRAKESGEQFTDAICMIQASNMVAANTGKSLCVYNLDTLDERILIKDVKGTAHPTGSIDGTKIFFPQFGLRDYIGSGVIPVTHIQIDIATGEIHELFREQMANNHHVVACPNNLDLLLIDRDFPNQSGGPNDYGNTKTRVWILNINTKALTEIRPKDENRFQIHSNWSYKGDYVYYHGTSGKHTYPTSPAGHYIGVADHSGKVVWEQHFPTFFYGHTGSHTRSNTIITDGLITKNLLTAIHFEELNSQNIPRIEIIAQHDANWVAGQNNHPHPHMSPDGKWLSYNRGTAVGIAESTDKGNSSIVKNIYGEQVGFQPNRSDVYVVKL